jgi:hypothetical protein
MNHAGAVPPPNAAALQAQEFEAREFKASEPPP